jgi:O-antigen/teichoic acid export membrane protein
VSLASISWVGFSNVDYAIIGARLGALQTGLYFRAYTLAVESQSKLGIVMNRVGFPFRCAVACLRLSALRAPSDRLAVAVRSVFAL